jgi:hypothetical protein
MDVRAHLLPSFSCAKGPDHGNLRCALTLRWPCIPSQNRVEVGRRRLVMVDAVQAEAEWLHDDTALSW